MRSRTGETRVVMGGAAAIILCAGKGTRMGDDSKNKVCFDCAGLPVIRRIVANMRVGGPLTIEVHDSAFREADGVEKVAQLVKFFVDRGGHQLQINAINRETLVDAQKNPALHRHLIVRVWGWSGYFIELDKPFQDQVIKRVELAMS